MTVGPNACGPADSFSKTARPVEVDGERLLSFVPRNLARSGAVKI